MYRADGTRYYRAQANEITFDRINRGAEGTVHILAFDVISMFDNVNVVAASVCLGVRSGVA